MEDCLNFLELLILRMECGFTFRQSLAGLDLPKVPPKLLPQFQEFICQALEGASAPVAATKNYYAFLKNESELRQLLEKSFRQPLAQQKIQRILFLMFALGAYFIFPEEISRSSILLSQGLSLVLVGLGAYWSAHLVKETQTIFWVKDWIYFLEKIKIELMRGKTFLQSFDEALREIKSLKLPASLCECLKTSHASLAQGQSPMVAETANGEWEIKCFSFWKLLLSQIEQGKLSDLLSKQSTHLRDKLKEEVQEVSEKLSLKLMLPLFICYLPAFFALLFLPLLLAVASL